VRNTWIVGTIVGQAVVTLVSIGYGVSAHSSWEAERQRRVAGERAAVAEMATAMKGAGDRIVTVEKELELCQVRLRRANSSQAPSAGLPAPAPARTLTAFPLVSGPLAWTASPTVEPQSESEAALPADEPGSAPRPIAAARCEGWYEPAWGTNFAPCPRPVR
jgi:hypothetical protein